MKFKCIKVSIYVTL